jgi:poly(A)-specific ribonuclease
MDIPRDTFLFHLPNILGDLTSCSFVSIDLEFSGIPLHSPRDGKQNLQEWYAQTKEAAERYQVLQIGLTIAKEDVTSGYPLCRHHVRI